MARTKSAGVNAFDADDYRARSDADTLMGAEEIRDDKERHQKAQQHVKKRFHNAARAMTKGKSKGSRYRAENVVKRPDMR